MFPFSRYVVQGHSMEPAYNDGDRIIINRLSYLFSKPKPGDVVAFFHPKERGKILIKKVETAQKGDLFIMVGLNSSDSQDSQEFGPIHRKKILGKILTRY